MNSITYKLLRPVSGLIFVVVMGLFLHELIFIHAPRRLPVTDQNHQVIGEVYVPHDSGDLKIFGFLALLGGLQMWAILSAAKDHNTAGARSRN